MPEKPVPLWRAMAQEIIAAVGEIPVLAAAFKGGHPLPLAIGTGPQLERLARERGAGDAEVLALHVALCRYCSSFEYLSALSADGATRHAVDGSVAAGVTDEHRDYALRALALRDKRKREAVERAAYERGIADGKAEAEKQIAAQPPAPAKDPELGSPANSQRAKLSLGAGKVPLTAAARLHQYGVRPAS